MKYTSDEIIREFYKFYKERNSDSRFNKGDMHDIITSLFRGIRDSMSSRDLPVIRLKNFGVLSIYNGRVVALLEMNVKRHKKGNISDSELIGYYEDLKYYIDNNIERFTKYKDRIEKVDEYVRSIKNS